MRSSRNLMLFALSVGLIGVAIIFTAVIDKSKSTSDVRARASQMQTWEVIGTVDGLDETTNELLVNNLAFESDSRKSYGDGWKVTSGGRNANIFNFSSGQRIRIKIDGDKFNIAEKSIAAAEITKL